MPAKTPIERLSRYTVLAVDDNPSNLSVLDECLSGYGFRILTARDGQAGLQRAEKNLPDLILLDVMMPGVNGFEICRRLKASPATHDIPVVFMTAMASPEDKVLGFAACSRTWPGSLVAS